MERWRWRNNGLTYDYDPVGLAAGVPILDVERNGQPVGGRCGDGESVWGGVGQCGSADAMWRGVVTLHGAEFLNLTPVAPDPTAIRDLERLE